MDLVGLKNALNVLFTFAESTFLLRLRPLGTGEKKTTFYLRLLKRGPRYSSAIVTFLLRLQLRLFYVCGSRFFYVCALAPPRNRERKKNAGGVFWAH